MQTSKFLKIAALVLSTAGAISISQFEDGPQGPSLTAYRDAVGVPTICTGSTSKVFIGLTATPLECKQRLTEDSTYAGKAIKRLVQVELTQEMYDSLVSFVFNVGGGNFSKSTLLKKLNNLDYCGAGHEFPRWDKAKGKVLRGLTIRRHKESIPFIQECK